MGRHPTLGFDIVAPADQIYVVAGPLDLPVAELAHAPRPLNGIREVIASGSYRMAARRHLRRMESTGMNSTAIAHAMSEPTTFTKIRICGEFAKLPAGAALKASSPEQAMICEAALGLARRGDVEGFSYSAPSLERPRLLVLDSVISETIEILDEPDEYTPAHFLPKGWQELFQFHG